MFFLALGLACVAFVMAYLIFVAGSPRQVPDGTLVYEGAFTWGLGPLAATTQVNRRYVARMAFIVAMLAFGVAVLVLSLFR